MYHMSSTAHYYQFFQHTATRAPYLSFVVCTRETLIIVSLAHEGHKARAGRATMVGSDGEISYRSSVRNGVW